MRGGELKSAVVLLVGNEGYLKEKAIDSLKASLFGSSSGDLDYKIFYAGEDNLREILDDAATIPFISKRRLVVLKDAERLSEEELSRLASYIKKPYKSTSLVLETSDKALINKLSEARRLINVVECNSLKDTEAYGWIRRFLNSRGILIEENAIGLLGEVYGRDLLSLSNELEKIISFKGNDKNITLEDVMTAGAGSPLENVFDFAWAIGEKNTAKAVKIISDLSMRGKKAYEIIGLLYWHFKRLLKARELKSEGETDSSIAGMLGLYKRNQGEFFKQLDLYDTGSLKSKIRLLLETDMDIKLTRFDPELVLEFAVIRLCLT